MKKNAVILLFLVIGIQACFAQLKTYSFEEIDSLQQIQKRKVVVFIHTDWCKYCQAMKNTTFKNKEVIKKINENFYFITLNAEERRTITFNNKNFIYTVKGNTTGIHQLAYELATINKQTNYPVICVLNPQNEIVFQQSNYLTTKDFLFLIEKLKEY